MFVDQREFNRQMSSYLRDRKDKRGMWSRLKDSMPKVSVAEDTSDNKQSVSQEVPIEQVQAVMRGEHISVEEDISEDDFSDADEKPGFFDRIRELIFGSYQKEELLHEHEELSVLGEEKMLTVDEDVKEMLRTCVRWLSRLPSDEISKIKRSQEYDDFKALLDKYGLLKK